MDNDLPEGVLRAKTVTRIVLSVIAVTVTLCSGWWTYQLNDARYEHDQFIDRIETKSSQELQRVQDQWRSEVLKIKDAHRQALSNLQTTFLLQLAENRHIELQEGIDGANRRIDTKVSRLARVQREITKKMGMVITEEN